MSLAALIHDVESNHTVIQLEFPARFVQPVDAVLNGLIGAVVIPAQITACINVGDLFLIDQVIKHVLFRLGTGIVEIGTEPLFVPLVESDGGVEIEQLMREQIQFFADVKKGTFGVFLDKNLIGLADGLFPFNEFNLVLNDLDGCIQLIALLLQRLGLADEGF